MTTSTATIESGTPPLARPDVDTLSTTSSSGSSSSCCDPVQEKSKEKEQEEEPRLIEDNTNENERMLQENLESVFVPAVIKSPSLQAKRTSVAERAKWLLQESTNGTNRVEDKPRRSTKRPKWQGSDKERSVCTNEKCNDRKPFYLAKGKNKSAVQLRKEAFEREELERKRNADPRSFLTTTWKAKPNSSFGKYNKKTVDSRGLPPKKSLADLP